LQSVGHFVQYWHMYNHDEWRDDRATTCKLSLLNA